jgi:hypothetical protein
VRSVIQQISNSIRAASYSTVVLSVRVISLVSSKTDPIGVEVDYVGLDFLSTAIGTIRYPRRAKPANRERQFAAIVASGNQKGESGGGGGFDCTAEPGLESEKSPGI